MKILGQYPMGRGPDQEPVKIPLWTDIIPPLGALDPISGNSLDLSARKLGITFALRGTRAPFGEHEGELCSTLGDYLASVFYSLFSWALFQKPELLFQPPRFSTRLIRTPQ